MHQGFRMPRQNGVAVFLGLDPHGGMEADGHRQAAGDRARLIDPPGPGAADVKFLQADDVGFELGDDADDTLDIQSLVDPDTAMDVIGD